MTEPVAEFIRRWRKITADESTPMNDRWQHLGQSAVDAVNALRGDCKGLLDAVGFKNPHVYQVVADAIDIYSEYPQAVKEDKQPGALGLMPILITHQSQSAAVPRNLHIDEWAPSLPAGNPVPALTDFLLTWEEAIEPRTIHKIHQVFRREDAGKRMQSLINILGEVGGPSHFDGLQQRGPFQRSLRFAPFYLYDDDSLTNLAVFDDPKQRSAWQEKALANPKKVLPLVDLIQPTAPTTYRNALWAGLRAQIVSTLEMLFDGLPQEWSSSSADDAIDPPRILIEPIGIQSLSIATGFRLSMLYEDASFTRGSLAAAYFETNWRSRWVSWKTVTNIVEEVALREFGSTSLTAQLVQEAGLILGQEGAGITIVLGPSVAFDPPEPERLAIESANDQAHEHAKWWEYEYRSIGEDVRAVQATFASAADKTEDEVDVFSSFVIQNSGWRPAFKVYGRKASSEKYTAVDFSLSEDELRATASMLGLMLGRQWVFVQMAGSQGFMTP